MSDELVIEAIILLVNEVFQLTESFLGTNWVNTQRTPSERRFVCNFIPGVTHTNTYGTILFS